MESDKKNQAGYTLVEMAIVLVVAALILAAAIAILVPIIQAARQLETQEKLTKIERALNAYALANYRIPCPAEPDVGTPVTGTPFGAEDGSGANGDTIPNGCPNITEGIVPFRTLGLPQDMVVDGWSNYITYAVSPVFTQDVNVLLAAAPPRDVHASCRMREWMMDVGYSNDNPPKRLTASKNPRKALFCCPGVATFGVATDLVINDEFGNLVVEVTNGGVGVGFGRTPEQAAETIFGEDWYDDVDARGDPYDGSDFVAETESDHFDWPQVPPSNIRATAPAYILISHGRNEEGAYTPVSGGRTPLPAAAQIFEVENTDGDNVYIDAQTRSSNEANAASFDDVVIWRTQDIIMASEGNTCSVP